MGAAGYVGRVGGLAIALGVGTAILTGQGVAYADDTDGSKPATTSSQDRTTNTETDTGKTAKRQLGKQRTTGGTSKRAGGEQNAGEESTTARSWDRRKRRDDAETQAAEQVSLTPADPVDATAVEATPSVEPRVRAWLNSPRVAAAREPKAATTTSAPVTTLVSGLLTAIRPAVSPSSTTNGGTTPVGGPATDLLLLAGARRELDKQQALAIPPYSVDVAEGIIGGCVVGPTCTTADGSVYTLVSDPSNGGKLALDATTGAFKFLPFAPETNTNGPSGQETFSVFVAQNTQFTTLVTGLPIVGSRIVAPVIMTLQQNGLFAPLIGTGGQQDIVVDIDDLRGLADAPVAYTTFVTSWDGTQISTNFFPAITTDNPDDSNPGYETVFYGPGLAQAGATDPTNPFVATFRRAGYNVVTWDPRGEFASGGVLQLDSPQYEGQDVSQLITWSAGLDGVELDAVNDPNMGMVGVSYGGGIQFVTAAGDSRVDAIAPGWAWNTLPSSLYPDQSFKTAYSSLLLLGLVETGARINPQIYSGIITGATLGILTPGQIQLLQTSGPGETVRGITAPTLIIQGTVDVLFPLHQAIVNAGFLAENENVKMLWYCGGHGSCLPGQGNPEADDLWVMSETLAWMDRYVKDDDTTDVNTFEWTDQNGDRWTSQVLPTENGFYDDPGSVPSTVWNTGKVLPIIPIVGGSGPNPEVPLPYSLGDGSIASNAVTIALQNPDAEASVVGAPQVVIHYSGLGTSRHVYAQVVDRSTGLVIGNLVTPVPVTLNGRDQTVTVDLSEIAYTVNPDSELELQIVTTATPFLNLTQFGFINIQSVEVTLPTTTQGTNQGPNPAPATVADELVAV